MENNKYDIEDLLIAIANEKPVDIQAIVNDLMVDRAQDEISSFQLDDIDRDFINDIETDVESDSEIDTDTDTENEIDDEYIDSNEILNDINNDSE